MITEPTILANFLVVDSRNQILGFKNNQGIDFQTNLDTLYNTLRMLWTNGSLNVMAPFPFKMLDDGKMKVLYEWVVDPLLLKMVVDSNRII